MPRERCGATTGNSMPSKRSKRQTKTVPSRCCFQCCRNFTDHVLATVHACIAEKCSSSASSVARSCLPLPTSESVRSRAGNGSEAETGSIAKAVCKLCVWALHPSADCHGKPACTVGYAQRRRTPVQASFKQSLLGTRGADKRFANECGRPTWAETVRVNKTDHSHEGSGACGREFSFSASKGVAPFRAFLERGSTGVG